MPNQPNLPPIPKITELNFDRNAKVITTEVVELDFSKYTPGINNGHFLALEKIDPPLTLAKLMPVMARPLPSNYQKLYIRADGYWKFLKEIEFPGSSESDTQYTHALTIEETSTSKFSQSVSATVGAAAKGLTGSVTGTLTEEETCSYTVNETTTAAFTVPKGTTQLDVAWQFCVDLSLAWFDGKDYVPMCFLSSWKPFPWITAPPSNRYITIGFSNDFFTGTPTTVTLPTANKQVGTYSVPNN